MAKVKVKYSVEELVTYSGEIEIEQEDYDTMQEMGYNDLGEALLDFVDRKDPQNWYVFGVDEFEIVHE